MTGPVGFVGLGNMGSPVAERLLAAGAELDPFDEWGDTPLRSAAAHGNLGLLDMPTFIYGSREDHIVPWQGAYASTALLKGKKRFVLGASGHIAGVVNPCANQRVRASARVPEVGEVAVPRWLRHRRRARRTRGARAGDWK